MDPDFQLDILVPFSRAGPGTLELPFGTSGARLGLGHQWPGGSPGGGGGGEFGDCCIDVHLFVVVDPWLLPVFFPEIMVFFSGKWADSWGDHKINSDSKKGFESEILCIYPNMIS